VGSTIETDERWTRRLREKSEEGKKSKVREMVAQHGNET